MPTPSTASHPVDARGRDWFRSAVVYQVYPRSFADSDGDGVGDLRGIIGKLDYLERLGVDVVWLSPVYRSPQDDNGYDISDYQDVDPLFGSLADLDELIEGLHARGMKLVMDLVVNHTSDEHPWFAESRASVDAPKRDWYWWRPPRLGHEPGTPGAEPNNWASFFSGSAWQYDEATGQYYLHLFSRKQPDLNWENPAVRQAVYAMMTWWLDRGVDGFRMDVINFLSKDPALADTPTDEGELYSHDRSGYVCGPRIHEFLQEMNREVFADRGPGLLKVGEMPSVTVEDAVLFTHPARGELDMVFQFEHVNVDWEGGNKWRRRKLRLVELKGSLGRWQSGLAERGWNSLYWSNHDQPRAVSRFGDDGAYREPSAKMLAGVLHLHRGTPYIFQGEELGMTNMAFAGIDEHRDIEVLNHYREATALGLDPAEVMASIVPLNRDNARTPVQWDAGPNAGFTTGTPWIAVNPNAAEINAAEQAGRDDSVFTFYRRLIRLRHQLPLIAHGDFTMLLPEHEFIYAFVRRYEGRELLVLGNFSGDLQRVDVGDSSWATAEVLLGNYPDSPGLDLRPWEFTARLRTTGDG